MTMRIDIFHHFEPDPEVRIRLDAVLRKVDQSLNKQDTIMSAIDDLKTALGELSGEVTRIAGEIDQLLTVIATPGTPDAEVAAATEQVRGLLATLRAASDKSDAAVP